MDNYKSKGIIVDKCAVEEDKFAIKGIIVDKCSIEEEESECVYKI